MARNLFIVGAGRSGTSLTAGLFRRSGHYQGSELYEARDSNPRGFFEDGTVNGLNEEILRPLLGRSLIQRRAASTPGAGQLWLARIPLRATISAPQSVAERIAAVLSNRPFCLKDPRFCYTLPVWQAHAPDARMICVFRHPRVVVSSVLKEIAFTPYLQRLAIGPKGAFEVWKLMYSHVLQHASAGEWLFVEYSDLFQPSVLRRIEAFAECELDTGFPDERLNRSVPIAQVDEEAQAIYGELSRRATR